MSPSRSETPLVFAHRGASDDLPEHTLEAYHRAIEQGADGLECDVRLTRDRQLVCIHDGRLDRTSNGTGRVSTATLADLQRLDFGSWHPRHQRDSPARVLTLDRLLATVVEYNRPLRLLIETKHPSRYGSAVEIQVVRMLREYGLIGGAGSSPVSLVLMSFSPLALRRARILAPEVPTAFLFDLAALARRNGHVPYDAPVLGPSLGVLRSRPELVRRAHEHGRQVYVWTVNRPEDVDFAMGSGVDGIITDRPAFVRHRVRTSGPAPREPGREQAREQAGEHVRGQVREPGA